MPEALASEINSSEETRQMPSIAVDGGDDLRRESITWRSREQTRASIGSQDSSASGVSCESSSRNKLHLYTSKTHRQQQQAQLLQEHSLDPAMHALRAQGADLDTGNGNFIMANRRRRSVHQVQFQQQQQHFQLQLHQHQHSSSFSKKLTRLGMSQDQQSSQEQQRNLALSNRMLRQADKLFASGASGAALIATKALRRQFDKLRTANSIDEGASSGRARERILSNRPRFVSEPANKYISEQQSIMTQTDSLELDESLERDLASIADNCVFSRQSSQQHPIMSLEPKQSIASSLGLNSPNEEDEEREFELLQQQQRKLLRDLESEDNKLDEEHFSNEQAQFAKNLATKFSKSSLEKLNANMTPAQRNDINYEHKIGHQDSIGLVKMAPVRRYELAPDLVYDFDQLEAPHGLLANLYQWNYPIFELAQEYGQSILSRLIYRIFLDSGFFESK